MEKKRGLWKWFLAAGVLLVVATVLWAVIAIPAYVKYPTDVNATPHYAGTFTLYVSPGDGSPLGQPVTNPMTIDRQLKALPSQSGADTVLVDEVITQKAGTLGTVQHNVYVMDRTSMKNIPDGRALAYDQPAINRTDAYRINLPFNTDKNASYKVAKNETGSNYTLIGRQPTVKRAGLTLDQYTATVNNQPVSPLYLTWLRKYVPLPTTVTLQQLKPQLKAAGVDVDALLAALGPSLTPADAATLNQVATTPVNVKYVYSFSGRAGIEPMTGAEVTVSATESLSAAPDLSGLAPLASALTKYQTIPQVAAALPKLAALSLAPPAKVFEYTYDQTPASVTDIAGKVKHQRDNIMFVKRWVPAGLLFLALINFVAAGWSWWRHRDTAAVHPMPVAPVEDAGAQQKAG